MEHAGHGTFAAGVTRDAFTFLYDKQRALDTLAKMQPSWGGDIATRMTAERARWQAEQAKAAAPPPTTEEGDTSAQEKAATPPPVAAATAVAPPSEVPENAQAPANGAID